MNDIKSDTGIVGANVQYRADRLCVCPEYGHTAPCWHTIPDSWDDLDSCQHKRSAIWKVP